jgi:hypothetical protein
MSQKELAIAQAVKSSADPLVADTGEDALEPSSVARAVERLKAASFKTAREREQVPQPLFWSLFHAQLQDIKAKKREARLLSELFGGSGE